MKILRIRLENLNSLKGRHEIDLAKAPLADAGLFAITGPTGAGKTTLLDAVTLALYGRAARYGKEANPENMMSRHCGECSAEVEFEVPAGKHKGLYRAVWQMRRARKKPDGKIQPPKRYVYDAGESVLAEKIGDAERLIEELIGLDYDRFLRSALLAQGEFARFLKARDDERAALLESLTGTVIYSELGRLAYTESVERERALKEKMEVIERIEILDEDERRELEAGIKSGEAELKKLDDALRRGAEMIKRIEKLRENLAKKRKAATRLKEIENERAEASGDLERLRTHRETEPFARDLAVLDAAEKAWNAARKSREQAEKDSKGAENEYVRAVAVFRASLARSIEVAERKEKKAGEDEKNHAREFAEEEKWLEAHETDGKIAETLADLVSALGDLKHGRGAVAKSWTAWKEKAAEILPEEAGALPESLDGRGAAEVEEMIDGFFKVARSRQSEMEKSGKMAKREWELRQNHFEMAQLMGKLESHRHRLEDGKPCPLCGALEHPWAQGAAPEPEIEELKREKDKAHTELLEVRERYKRFRDTVEELESERREIFAGLHGLEGKASEAARFLEPLSVTVPGPGEEDRMRRELRTRAKDHENHAKAKQKAEALLDKARVLAEESRRITGELRKKLGGVEKLPEDVEKAVGLLAPGELPDPDEAEEICGAASKRRTAALASLSTCRKSEEKAEGDFRTSRKALEARLEGSGIPDIAALRGARLPAAEAERIGKLEKHLGDETTRARALGNEAAAEVEKLREAGTLEGEEAGEFVEKHEESKEERDALLREQVRRKEKRERDDENREWRKRMEEELGREREDLKIWRILRDLIGSHDGAKFRKYAQGISLEILARHANRHLRKFSDRYRIQRDGEELLGLQIEDLHQAGVRRPMASLSGGESFLVSLSLALGLSDLAGRTVRIDSLFIDEGFGSLDSETLETAISALESLQLSRKTVGVISHVDLLKERIATRIVVEKLPGEWSEIKVVG